MKYFLAIFLATFFLSSSHAEENHTPFWEFQLSELAVLQSGGGNSFGPQLGWTPRFGGDLGIRGIAAFSVMKGSLNNAIFLSPEAQVLASFRVHSYEIEAGGGIQSWLGQGVTSAMGTAQFN